MLSVDQTLKILIMHFKIFSIRRYLLKILYHQFQKMQIQYAIVTNMTHYIIITLKMAFNYIDDIGTSSLSYYNR